MDKEIELEQAYSRLEVGEPPDNEAAKEWMKYLHRTINTQQPLNNVVRLCKLYIAL